MRREHCRILAALAVAFAAAAFVFALAGMIGCGSSDGNATDGLNPGSTETVENDPLPSDDEVRRRVDDAIRLDFVTRRLSVKEQAAWQILHAVVAYGRNVLIHDFDDKIVPAVDYVLAGKPMNGWDLRPGDALAGGRQGVRAILAPGSTTGMGHKDQWLGYMAISDCGLDVKQTIKVGGRDFTIGDWVEQILRDVHDGTEHGWTLMVLAHYIDPKHEWTAGDGQKWSMERVIALESSRDVNSAACGGTHSLGGMTVALNRYVAAGGQIHQLGPDGKPLRGSAGKLVYVDNPWGAAARKIDEHVDIARGFQQADGSFSASYFSRAEKWTELAHLLRTTGHTLEFLSLALNDEQLRQPWVTRAALQMCAVIEATKSQPIECGALYHGMHGLVRYRQRRFGPLDLSKLKDEVLQDHARAAKTASNSSIGTGNGSSE